MSNRAAFIETFVGLFMLLAFIGIIFLALRVSGLTNLGGVDSYEITARFNNISGLKVRAPVSMAGVQIGRVTQIKFDSETFEAIVNMNINQQFSTLPLDTSATIYTAGLLGEKYVGLEPGAEEDALSNGSEIQITQSSLILENLIGKFFTSIGDKD